MFDVVGRVKYWRLLNKRLNSWPKSQAEAQVSMSEQW